MNWDKQKIGKILRWLIVIILIVLGLYFLLFVDLFPGPMPQL